jgi:hypothetical protein
LAGCVSVAGVSVEGVSVAGGVPVADESVGAGAVVAPGVAVSSVVGVEFSGVRSEHAPNKAPAANKGINSFVLMNSPVRGC